jgi:glycosyltransferase involved in cell wall biosynthesis
MEAARRLLYSGRSGFTIDIFGGGMDDYYQCLILDFGLQDHVHLRGSLPQSDLIARFWDYDIFLFPTWSREPFGFAPLEAASCGCVPIISRECGIAEWCVDGVHAIKVAPEAEALAETVGRILDEKTDLVSIARRARWAISTGFSLQRVGDYVERAFDEVRHSEAVRPGRPEDAYNLGRLAERLALDWAARPQNLGV